jgi:hypothetical protein
MLCSNSRLLFVSRQLDPKSQYRFQHMSTTVPVSERILHGTLEASILHTRPIWYVGSTFTWRPPTLVCVQIVDIRHDLATLMC